MRLKVLKTLYILGLRRQSAVEEAAGPVVAQVFLEEFEKLRFMGDFSDQLQWLREQVGKRPEEI